MTIRRLPLEADSIDFVVTSPPYINVFNYHQNYRRSAEILGWGDEMELCNYLWVAVKEELERSQ